MLIMGKAFASLKYKVMLLLVGALIVALGGIIVFESRGYLHIALELKDEINRNQIRLIARQSAGEHGVIDGDSLEAFIYDFISTGRLSSSSEIVDITILSSEGDLIKRKESFYRPDYPDNVLPELARRAQTSGKIERREIDGVLVLAAPIFARKSLSTVPVGSVAVAWDTAGIRDVFFNSAILQGVIALFGACVVVGPLLIGVHRLILRPLHDLTDGVSREDGQIPAELLDRQDEIGVLARGFAGLLTIIKGRSEAEIADRSMQLDAALSNMSQGLLLFDSNGRLILGNRRYQDFYGIPDGVLVPGAGLRDILTSAYEAGNFEGEDLENVLARRRGMLPAEGTEATITEVTRDGRHISARIRRTPAEGFVVTFTDVTEQARNAARIEHMALHDALTDLPNRVMYCAELDRALERAKRGKTQAVFCLDLDHFKLVNDTLGHPVGDELLRRVSDRLRKCLRQGDLVARLGGDEFAVLRDDVESGEDPSRLARRIVEALSEPYQIDGHTVVIGASVGIALAPTDGTDADRLMKSADLALYRAKALGRGTWSYFEKEMDAQAQERRALELELRQALKNDEFEVHYQPIIDLEQERVTCLEALLRWHHPERGLVPPDKFIPLAEEIGVINQIGAWVLRRACLDAAEWPDSVRVAVNLSPVQVRGRSLVHEVDAALDASGLDPDRLELEITETVLIQDTAGALRVLEELRAIGVRIAMDDFGTGYSSLSYLRKFQFDKIKVDRSFVSDLRDDEDGLAIIRAVTGLGTSLGISTCAEGVETLEQLELLRREGCDEAQGFFYSVARPRAEIATLIETLARGRRSVA